ncbi:MAG: hypothetical protein ACE5G5_14175 [Candidatus Methylomirabilales bacterium]
MGRANLANGARDDRDHCLSLPSRASDAGKVSCLWRPDLTGPTIIAAILRAIRRSSDTHR